MLCDPAWRRRGREGSPSWADAARAARAPVQDDRLHCSSTSGPSLTGPGTALQLIGAVGSGRHGAVAPSSPSITAPACAAGRRGAIHDRPPDDRRSAVGGLAGATCHQIETAPRTPHGQAVPLWARVLLALVRFQQA